MSFTGRLFLVTVCLAVLLALNPSSQAFADDPNPAIYISPDVAHLFDPVSGQVTLDVMVSGAKKINAFEFKIVYDNTIVAYKSFEIGTFLKNVMCPIQYIGENYVHVVCTQLATEGQSGSGTLMRLTFSGVAEGVSAIAFAHSNLVNHFGYTYYPDMTDGTIYVVDPSEIIYLPLIMNISAQGAQNRQGIKVALGRGTSFGMGPFEGTSVDLPGNNLTIPNVVSDSYRLTTNHPRVLNVTGALNKTFTLAVGANILPPLRLVAGNAIWTDSEINIQDWTLVCGALGSPSPAPDADVNFDGVVNARDLSLVAGNWGLTSALAYAGWLP